MTRFDEGGRGRKLCPGCQKYVGAVSHKCDCGYQFKITAVDSGEISTYDEGGRGRKQCAGCKKFIGAKNAACACGSTEFVKKNEGPTVVSTYDEGGRGRKQCAGCGKYIGNRVSTCACGSTEFKRTETEEKEFKTYTEPGVGRKQCAGCQKYIGARHKACECGSTEFVKRSNGDNTKDVVTYDVGGIGKKQCNQCKKFVGARVSQCACGFNFESAKAAKVALNGGNGNGHSEKPAPLYSSVDMPSQYTLGTRHIRVSIPSGVCPVKLTSIDEDSIHEWAQKVIDIGLDRNVEYMSSALKYWISTFYAPSEPEWAVARQIVDDLEPLMYMHVSEMAGSDPDPEFVDEDDVEEDEEE